MFSKIIKILRVEKGITQQKVADELKISRSALSNYEAGLVEPTLSVIKKLADFFQVSTDYLLGREDDFGNITIQSESPQLTDSERELLENFRSLSPYLQGIAAETLRNWAGKTAQKSESTTKRA